MKRYEVRAYVADRDSLTLGKPQKWIELKKFSRPLQATETAYAEFQKFRNSNGFLVYDMTHISAVDTKTNEVLESFEFDIAYLVREVAEKALDDLLDENYPNITVAEGSYPTSYVLKCVDPQAYEGALNVFVEKHNSAII